MKLIPITGGGTAQVDDEDYERIARWSWRLKCDPGQRLPYARRTVATADGRRTSRLMHHEILDCKSGQWVDHVNADGLDNRRVNLRLCSIQENARNRRVLPLGRRGRPKSSRFKGVCWSKVSRRWIANIGLGGKVLYLGCFTNEVEAALAYDAAAHQHFGAFARPNFPPTPT